MPPRAFPADRAFSATQNGLLPKGEGVFGAFNLRAPSASSTGARAPASFVELRFTFMANGSNVPLVLPRTQLTFHDLGSGLGGLRECMQIRGTHASSTMSFVSDKTELTADEYNASGASGSFRAPIQDLLNIVPAGGSPVRFLYPSTDPSATPLYCSTAQGIGADKPQDPYMLTGVQRTRSVIFDFHNVASFDVRHSLSSGTGITGGRDFLFGGLSNVMPPFCDFSSPSGAAASSKEHPRHTISGDISTDSFKERPGRRLQNKFTPSLPPPLPPPPPPLPPLSPGCRCSNDCVGAPEYAEDDNCDDGGFGSSYDDCELGTDCADCGGQVRCLWPPSVKIRASCTCPALVRARLHAAAACARAVHDRFDDVEGSFERAPAKRARAMRV